MRAGLQGGRPAALQPLPAPLPPSCTHSSTAEGSASSGAFRNALYALGRASGSWQVPQTWTARAARAASPPDWKAEARAAAPAAPAAHSWAAWLCRGAQAGRACALVGMSTQLGPAQRTDRRAPAAASGRELCMHEQCTAARRWVRMWARPAWQQAGPAGIRCRPRAEAGDERESSPRIRLLGAHLDQALLRQDQHRSSTLNGACAGKPVPSPQLPSRPAQPGRPQIQAPRYRCSMPAAAHAPLHVMLRGPYQCATQHAGQERMRSWWRQVSPARARAQPSGHDRPRRP